MKLLYFKLLLLIIGIIILYLLFFPINYKFNKEKYKNVVNQDLKQIFEQFKLKYNSEQYIYSSNAKICYIIFPLSSNFIKDLSIDCALYFNENHFILNFKETLDFLNSIYIYFQYKFPEIGIISENTYNTLSLFLGAHHPNISILVLKGELFPTKFPEIYNYIQPRLCINSSNLCTQYKIINYVNRTEIYESINIPVVWVITKKEIMDTHNPHIKKSLKIFHTIGTKQFTPKWIINNNEIHLLKLENQVKIFNKN